MMKFKPRYFVLPAITLVALAMLHPVDGGCLAKPACGAVLHVVDPEIRASFAVFAGRQSATAEKICALASNTRP